MMGWFLWTVFWMLVIVVIISASTPNEYRVVADYNLRFRQGHNKARYLHKNMGVPIEDLRSLSFKVEEDTVKLRGMLRYCDENSG